METRKVIGFASYRSASADSQALASTLAELMLRAIEGPAKREPAQSSVWAKRRDGRAAALLFWPNEPDGWIHRQLADEPVGAARLRISQTNTTNQRTMIFCPNKANYLRKRSQSGKSNENNV
jgi:hypothetical protein